MRKVVALAVGLVLSTLLLGGGWLWASLRERDGQMREARGRLMRSADLVRGAVDESLEELRAREDERPFYLYNHFYSPPDVLAISDPVAISPLAHDPSDGRIVGHFQIDPAGHVMTPYDADADEPTLLTLRVRTVMETAAFAPLRALATGESTSTMLARSGEDPREETETATVEAPTADWTLPPDPLRMHVTEPESSDEIAGLEGERAPLTTGLNEWGNQLAHEITAAQAGDENANIRLMERGRQTPVISRRNVRWDEMAEEQHLQQQNREQRQSSRAQQQAQRQAQRQAQQQAQQQAQPQAQQQAQQQARAPSVGGRGPEPGASAIRSRPSTGAVRAALERLRGDVLACTASESVQVRLQIRGSDGRPETIAVDELEEDEAPCVRTALRRLRVPSFSSPLAIVRYAYRDEAEPTEPDVSDSIGLDNMVRRALEVTYTHMRYREVEGTLELDRIVSHDGVSIVQGLLLDRSHIVEQWIPDLVARHIDAGEAPSVVLAGAGDCAVRRPASSVVGGIELCFGPGALAAATQDLDVELRWQVAGLVALWLIALLAAAAIVDAARRAEALSRQKSAFVSAVSHELRTPLTTLRMHAEMLDEEMVTEERRPKVHRELVRESVRLARLVDNVLSLSKLEEGKRRLHRTEGDLHAHVKSVVASQRGFVEERDFTLEGPTDEGPVTALFDAQAVEQIIVNLLDNAVKYAAGDDKVIEVSATLRGGTPTVIVRDRGPGIPEEERDKVFERFHRVEREEHAHAPGTGIGLALVAELAEAHGGSASVHARDGGGLEVRIALG